MDDRKLSYIKTAKKGTLLAFRVSDTKAKSAKVTMNRVEEKMLEVETSYGVRYAIAYDEVLWVKTGARWPKGVMKMFHGIKEDEGVQDA